MTRLKNTLFSLLLLALVLLLVEGASWVVLKVMAANPDPIGSETHLFDVRRSHRLNPAFRFSDDLKSAIHSEDGFRADAPVSVSKEPGTLRIIALGASTLYGSGATSGYPQTRHLYNDETITHFLQAELQSRMQELGKDTRIEVINAGVSAYQTPQELLYLQSRLLAYGPDMVLSLDGHNDFYIAHPSDIWNNYPYSGTVLVDQFNGRSLFLPVFTFVRALAPHSNTFNLLERIMKRIWNRVRAQEKLNPEKDLPSPEQGDPMQNARAFAEANYLRNLWTITQLGKREHFSHVVFLQPEIVFEKPELLSTHDQTLRETTLGLLPEGQQQIMTQLRTRFPDWFAEEGIAFHDVAELATNAAEGDLYTDYCHLTPLGSELLGKRMAALLLPAVIERLERVNAPVQTTP